MLICFRSACIVHTWQMTVHVGVVLTNSISCGTKLCQCLVTPVRKRSFASINDVCSFRSKTFPLVSDLFSSRGQASLRLWYSMKKFLLLRVLSSCLYSFSVGFCLYHFELQSDDKISCHLTKCTNCASLQLICNSFSHVPRRVGGFPSEWNKRVCLGKNVGLVAPHFLRAFWKKKDYVAKNLGRRFLDFVYGLLLSNKANPDFLKLPYVNVKCCLASSICLKAISKPLLTAPIRSQFQKFLVV